MGKRKRSPGHGGAVLTVLKMLLLGMGLTIGCVAVVYKKTHVPAGKYDPVTEAIPPAAPQVAIQPERQVEGHTCGLHTLESIYKSYGLDPAGYRLRFRLGADHPAIKFDDETTGTLQPDMLRVLRQDGFVAQAVKTSEVARIRAHLEAGHYAAAIVMRSVHHWIVLAELKDNKLVIVDSLVREPYQRDFNEFVDQEAYNILLIKPGSEHQKARIGKAHREGIRDMLRTWRAGK